MNRLIDFVLRLFDLIEAEARAAQRNAAQFAVALVLWIAAGAFFMVGSLAVAAALFFAVRPQMGPGGALFLSALIPLVLAAICFLLGRHVLDRGRS